MRSLMALYSSIGALLLTAITSGSVMSCTCTSTYRQHQRSSICVQPAPGLAARRDGQFATMFPSSDVAAEPE